MKEDRAAGMRVRKVFDPPPHPAAHNVFKFIAEAVVKVAPFEASSTTARAFLAQAVPSLRTCQAFQLKVYNIDPPKLSAGAPDKFQSSIEVKLHDGHIQTFGPMVRAIDIFKELKTHASMNGLEPK